MERTGGKQSSLKNILVRVFLFCILIIGFRFAYIVTVRGQNCDLGQFCFFSSSPQNVNLVSGVRQLSSLAVAVVHSAPAKPRYPNLWTNQGNQKAVLFYSSVFHDLIADGYLSPESKALCLETPAGDDVFGLKEIGVTNSVGIYKRAKPPLVLSGHAIRQPFDDNTFDFIFSGPGAIEKSEKPSDFAAEVARTLKPEGFLVVHTASNDSYSFNSFIGLFNCCRFIRSRKINGFDSTSIPYIREIVMKRVEFVKSTGELLNKCSYPVPKYKRELVSKAESLILTEPLKPWITLKRNIKNVKYLTTMADINFKERYVYIDVGARSYGSSIVSWFKKQYPKQEKFFEIYAIEADRSFHEEYKYKKGVKLLPYAAWVKNETLSFEINYGPGFNSTKETGKNGGMGRIRPAQSSSINGDVDRIEGFDFADWLKKTVSEKDFVVMKMDVEGTEFDLIPRLLETKAICLIDEIFLECHYNRWQICCPGVRSTKYEKSYGQCLELFNSLRKWGVLVHQWW
ncbi:hypothetical protein LguiB_015489 [Lonicera macranthoides]